MGKITAGLIRKVGPWGGYAGARLLTRSHPRLLMYHRFSAQPAPGRVSRPAFRAQLQHLKQKYNVISLDRLVACLKHGERPPPLAVVITIDDGYRDFYDYAYPELHALGLPATLFVTTGFVDGDLWLWPDEMEWMLEAARCVHHPIQGGDQVIATGVLSPEGRTHIWRQLTRRLMPLTPRERSDALSELSGQLEVERPQRFASRYAPVTWDQLREMEEADIAVGGHTVNHATLSRRNEAIFPQEIEHCRQALDRELAACNRHFCFPNGQPEDKCVEAEQAIRAAGFQSACVAFHDRRPTANIFALRRYGVGQSAFGFTKSITGTQRLGSLLLGRHNRFRW